MALNKPTSQTSTWLDFYASRAVDGELDVDNCEDKNKGDDKYDTAAT